MNERLIVIISALTLLSPVGSFAQLQMSGPPTAAECAKLCDLDADNVPPTCDCSLAGGTGGGAGTSEERTVLDLLNDVQAGYVAQMASIENYWIVEASDSSPYPITRYFERKPGTDSSDPTYREVPPDELARREMLNDPRLSEEEKQAYSDPAAMYGGYAKAMDAFGQVTGEATGGATSGAFAGVAEAFRGVESGAKAYQDKRETEAGESGGISQLIHYISQMLLHHSHPDDVDSVKLLKGWYFPLRPVTDTQLVRDCNNFDDYEGRFVGWELNALERCPDLKESYDIVTGAYVDYFSGQRPMMPNPVYGIPCLFVRVLNDMEISFEGNDYTVQKGSEVWRVFTEESPPAYYKMRLLTLDVGGYRQITLEREMFIHRPAGPMIVAREIRERMNGLVGGLIEEHKSIRSVGFNQGPPTQDQIQQSTW